MSAPTDLSREKTIRAEALKAAGVPPLDNAEIDIWAHSVHMLAHYIQSGEQRFLLAAGTAWEDDECGNPRCWYFKATAGE